MTVSNLDLHKELAVREFITAIYEDGSIDGVNFLHISDLGENFITKMTLLEVVHVLCMPLEMKNKNKKQNIPLSFFNGLENFGIEKAI